MDAAKNHPGAALAREPADLIAPERVAGVDPDPDHVTLGMKVKLATYPIGTDDNGTEAIGFGFEPS